MLEPETPRCFPLSTPPHRFMVLYSAVPAGMESDVCLVAAAVFKTVVGK